jgi:hypothetical protein
MKKETVNVSTLRFIGRISQAKQRFAIRHGPLQPMLPGGEALSAAVADFNNRRE